MNPFDSLKLACFATIATTMGYDAVWQKEGGEEIPARVLFNEPTREEEVGSHDYGYRRPTLEYKGTDWPGLKELVEAKEQVIVSLRGRSYEVLSIEAEKGVARDGEVFTAILQEVMP